METSNQFRPQHHVVVDMLVFRPSASGEFEILLIQRGKDPFAGQWAFPGGFVNYGEQTQAAAHRELQEETGLVVDKSYLVGVFDDPKRDPRGPNIGVAYRSYIAWTEGHDVAGADDAQAARWWSVNNLPELAFDHKHILEQALEL